MSLIDDFIASSDTEHGPAVNLFNDTRIVANGYSGFETLETPQLDTGYVSTGFGQIEKPIFSLDYVQFQLPSTLVDMAVSNNILIIALDIFRILRIDLDNPLEVEDIEIARKPSDGKIERIFFDPTGRHLLITTDHGENYYLYEKWRKAKHLSKLKGMTITSVAWNKQATLADPSTKEILLGTKKGLIYETLLEPTDEFFRREQRYLEQVYSIHESTMPITGLHFEQFPVHNRKYFVLATTSTRIYQFVGFIGNGSNPGSRSPVISYNDTDDQRTITSATTTTGEKAIFEGLFAKYDVNPGFQELPGELPHSQVHFFSKFHELQQQGVAQVFAWLTGPGVYRGDLVFGSQNVGDSVIDNVQLLPYPTSATDDDGPQVTPDFPLAMALTEFHYILLYKDRVRAICQLNDQVVYEEIIPLNHGEQVIDMAVDDIKKTFWVYTSQSIYELVINNEERDVWKMYLEKSQYNMALQYCKDPAQKDKVYTAQAKDYFEQKRYQMSAQFFAESTMPFEHVTLQFIEQDEMDALRVYLSHKLDRLQKKDRSQKTMLATWLVELYLSKLDSLDNCDEDEAESDDDYHSPFAEQRHDVMDEFLAFLDSYHAHLHPPTTYHLMSNHGRSQATLHYASLIRDHDRIIRHWIAEKQWKKALEVLSKQVSNKGEKNELSLTSLGRNRLQNNKELFYQFSPVLMENEPHETVNVWMRQTTLNPRRLIPALLNYDHTKFSNLPNQAIRYLSFVVSTLENTDAAIHNFLLTLYATQPTNDESALLSFLKNEGRDMQYNLDYALRLCNQHGRTQSCVHIYGQMGLYEEAVHLALQNHDIELACINADKPEDDDELRKKLWLTIAEQVVKESKDIKSTMRFLSESQLLHIDDILPYFQDFKTISDYKHDICTALEDYNHQIEDLKTEMEDATKNADNIRIDIQDLKSRFGLVNPIERCYICQQPLLGQPLYLFPCQHAFHANCMIQQVTDQAMTRPILTPFWEDRLPRIYHPGRCDASPNCSTFWMEKRS
ncbi:hypothetical protein DM01DRAFT_1046133 [Hesseltinella vesiculosa]|uniref:Uncharacterized protein n=1 Tax=Hesseltinella vesiculosa TaxID=101127 RepID=A0A1X2GHY6_9FUNG|nr:hypothetical protein DM01DRAFT_1046133 [Hesseltinella vesiculosa]